jgi:hypothetical protein
MNTPNRVSYKDIEKLEPLRIRKNFKANFQGSIPAPFIGRFNYPNVNVGMLSPQYGGDTSYFDSPALWSKAKFSISKIAHMRYSLVNSQVKSNVKNFNTRYLDLIKESGISKKPIEVEVNLFNKPKYQAIDSQVTPFGPRSVIHRASVVNNSGVDTRVDRVISDTDLKANSAVVDLYKKGFDVTKVNRILSVGEVGVKKSRKLVPTRWSITAVDDIVSKNLLSKIRDLPVGDNLAYFGGNWGNFYLILFFSENFRYELFETYLNMKSNPWSKSGFVYSTDYEEFLGRKNYATETSGGYYAARLPVCEKLVSLGRQGGVLALRFITPDYTAPLGVWVCRQASRMALESKPVSFASSKLMLDYSKELIFRKFGFDLDLILKNSKMLKYTQKSMLDY